MKNTSKHVKDKDRWSWIQPSLDYCYLCSRRHVPLEKHEVYNGFNRQASKDYGFVIALCPECHRRIHRDQVLDNRVKMFIQKVWMAKFHKSEEDFRKIFHKSYLGVEDGNK